MSWAEVAVLEDDMPKDIDFDTGSKKSRKRIKKKNRIFGIGILMGTENNYIFSEGMMSDDGKSLYYNKISTKYNALASELWYSDGTYWYEYNHNIYVCCRHGIYKYDGELFTEVYHYIDSIVQRSTSHEFINYMYFKNGKAYIYSCYTDTPFKNMKLIVDLETGVVTSYNVNENSDVASFPSRGSYQYSNQYCQSALFVDDDENLYYIYFKTKGEYKQPNSGTNTLYTNWCLCKRSTDGTFTVIMQQLANDIWSGIQSCFNNNQFCGPNVLVHEKNNVFNIVIYYRSTMNNIATYYRQPIMFYINIDCNDSNIVKLKYTPGPVSGLPASPSINETFIKEGHISNQVTIDAANSFILCVCGSTTFRCINDDVYVFNPGIIWTGRSDRAGGEDNVRQAHPLGGSFIKTSIPAILNPTKTDSYYAGDDTKPAIIYEKNNNLLPLLSGINAQSVGICCVLTDFLESEIENEETLTEYDYESFYV